MVERIPLTEQTPARGFRVVGHVVTAVKRFQASLNPTVTFKKRNSEEDDWERLGHGRALSVDSGLTNARLPPKSLSSSMRQLTRTPSGRWVPRKTFEQRGHMTGYLLKPLPELRASS